MLQRYTSPFSLLSLERGITHNVPLARFFAIEPTHFFDNALLLISEYTRLYALSLKRHAIASEFVPGGKLLSVMRELLISQRIAWHSPGVLLGTGLLPGLGWDRGDGNDVDGVAGATPGEFEAALPRRSLDVALCASDSSSIMTAISSVEAFTSVIAWCAICHVATHSNVELVCLVSDSSKYWLFKALGSFPRRRDHR